MLINDIIINASEKYQRKVAFTGDHREVTFTDIFDEASKMATYVSSSGIMNQPIAVFMDKSVECINAMLGVTLSGNFYTVIDTKMPEARINKIIEVLKPAAFITDSLNAPTAYNFSENVLIYEDAMDVSADFNKIQKIKDQITPENTLYVLFTSGSTGTPKGVIISHKAVLPYLEWLSEEFSINEETVFANQTPFYFVMSGLDIYMTLFSGATCHIIPKRFFSFPVTLLNFLKEKHVNTLYWVPSILCLIANFRALPEVHLDDLKLVMFSGEVMPCKQLNMWRKEYPDVMFVNQYGPTEMTDIIAFYTLDRMLEDNESIPIGKPAKHMNIMLLDDERKPVRNGETGELCGYGPSLADGYYNMPEKTAEVFIKNPAGEGLIYCTGDLARFDEDGNLVYMGRKDFQIKHMGNRIELGEIETAVSALDGILQCCCHYDSERKKIVLFYTGSINEDEIVSLLSTQLPEYMIPNRIEKMDCMPINLNGKIDRTALKNMI